ncbi:AAA family ATPase [Desulforamulus aeronauticus]|uniref:Predicted ATPase, AAA+ superfamily n=1 Tax=Desulforamulus aeronauticus DSM 10349 TaxID=1121421 RepID=A0A1M6QFK3_9FIRM|nr:ATP-binding protein [Desulforamulus aeronauticus]SHK18986.1 Predicted ATPase, AAA+ superfamily [Desulforamulus aeronauticus DSM 10349]
MNYYSEILKIIDGGIRGDVQKVVDYSLLLADKLNKSGDDRKAQRIRSTVEKQGYITDKDILSLAQNKSVNYPRQIPFDQESKLELANIFLPNQLRNKKLILSYETLAQIEEFIKAYQNYDDLVAHNLEIPTTMLLFGPPGCGKTETAFSIARRLDLPIVVARLDTMISSYLGSTAKNIRFLFDYAKKNQCVLFLDEFDAVAKLRDDIHEMGELKRVVNSLLQNIDTLDNRSVLIAATNHEKLLDPAIWRRFSTRINISLPNSQLILEVINELLLETDSALDNKSVEFLILLFKGQAIADIQQIIKRAIRKTILDKRKLELPDVVESYFDYTQIIIETEPESIRNSKLEYLFNVKSDLSYRLLGEILRLHHKTAKKLADKINEVKGVK